MTIGSLAVTAGAVHAQPVTASTATSATVNGSDDGVNHTIVLDPDAGTVSTVIDRGKFQVTPDGKAVTVTDTAGDVLARIPMAVRMIDHEGKYALMPTVGKSGRTLTLTPLDAPIQPQQIRDAARAQFADQNADVLHHQYNAGVGALIGMGAGILIGIWFLLNGAIPGAPVGAGIGALIGYALP
ncbi:hypothetical protein [Nocardia alni]|uniref:hypothetical protein n=1 Tax=Nocardia alni TaxID=2815723 RepID=UPI001C21B85F|nr:hypothetical protein [Nocardia alni]